MIVSIKMDCLDFYDFKMRERLKIEFKHVHYWSTIPLSYFMTIFCFLSQGKDRQFLKRNISFEILSDFNEADIWNKIDLPECPNCFICKLKEACNTQGKYILEKRILEKKKECVINQSEFNQFCN